MKDRQEYPARTAMFHEVAVTVLEIDGKDFITAEDLGRCLGLADPRRSVHKIFRKNQNELEDHVGVAELATPLGGVQSVRLFTETGCNLIAMFARTPRAKEFRRWLAQLPRRVRELAGTTREQLMRAEAREVEKALGVLMSLGTDSLGLDGLIRLVWLRRQGLTQKEAGAALGVHKDTVGRLEREMERLGVEFPEINFRRRRTQIREAFAAALTGAPHHDPHPRGGKGLTVVTGP